jgi:hypothetical protein
MVADLAPGKNPLRQSLSREVGMPKSRMSRLIALLALLTVALMLAIASAGDPGDGFTSGEDGVGFQPKIELHFGW